MAGNITRSFCLMSKNDDRILELKKQIDEKKKLLADKNTRFVPETNCVLTMNKNSTNINVCSDEELKLLLISLNAYLMSAKDLGMNDFEISGYSVTSWIKDIKNKLEISGLKKQQSDLKTMEQKLDKLLSDDKKTELVLDDIAALLK